MHNLTDAVDRVVRAHRSCLAEPEPPPQETTPENTSGSVAEPSNAPEGRRVTNTRRRHADVHAHLERGMRLTEIGRRLDLDVKTVRRYARAITAEELLTRHPGQGRQLDAHTGFLARRWQDGCDNAARLTQELREHGSERSVRRLLQTWRTGDTPTGLPPRASPKLRL